MMMIYIFSTNRAENDRGVCAEHAGYAPDILYRFIELRDIRTLEEDLDRPLYRRVIDDDGRKETDDVPPGVCEDDTLFERFQKDVLDIDPELESEHNADASHLPSDLVTLKYPVESRPEDGALPLGH